MHKSKLNDSMKREVMALKPSQVPDQFMGSDSDLVTVEQGWSYEEAETEQFCSGIVMLLDVLVPKCHTAWINPLPAKKRVVNRVGQIDKGLSSTLQWALPSCLQNSVYVSIKWHAQMTAPLHSEILCFILWKLSQFWWWRLTIPISVT